MKRKKREELFSVVKMYTVLRETRARARAQREPRKVLLISSLPSLPTDRDSIPTFCPSDQPGSTLCRGAGEPLKFTEQGKVCDDGGALGCKSWQLGWLGAGDSRVWP